MPIDVNIARLEDNCETKLVPTPKTVCWEEEATLCAAVPTLVEQDEHLNKCGLGIGEDECQRVRLTIPTEVCYPVERYHPYPQRGYGGPYPFKTRVVKKRRI